MSKLLYDEYQKEPFSIQVASASNTNEELSCQSIPVRHVILLVLQSFIVSFLSYGINYFQLAMNNIYIVASPGARVAVSKSN